MNHRHEFRLALVVAGMVVLGCSEDAPVSPADAPAPTDAAPSAALFPHTDQIGEPLSHLTAQQRDRFEQGRAIFEFVFTPETGLGPLFNSTSCATCHRAPVTGGTGSQLAIERHGTVYEGGECYDLKDQGGPVFQNRVTPALADALGISAEPVPPEAETASRTTPDVFGFGLLDAVPDWLIVARADPHDADGDGISGRVAITHDGRIGRFGRKAEVATLAEFNEGAFQAEQGITVPAVPTEGTVGGLPMPDGVDPLPEPELDAEGVVLSNSFVQFLAPPAPSLPVWKTLAGRVIFRKIGCASCHAPTLATGYHEVAALRFKLVQAYTDLLLHDMGPELADICLGSAEPREFRTEPLMGLRFVTLFMHDGRAGTIEEAILAHGGEASASRDAFQKLSAKKKERLLEFLGSL